MAIAVANLYIILMKEVDFVCRVLSWSNHQHPKATFFINIESMNLQAAIIISPPQIYALLQTIYDLYEYPPIPLHSTQYQFPDVLSGYTAHVAPSGIYPISSQPLAYCL